jgi:hypothetical protein
VGLGGYKREGCWCGWMGGRWEWVDVGVGRRKT